MEGKFVVFMLLFCAVAVIGKSIMEDYGISVLLYSFFKISFFHELESRVRSVLLFFFCKLEKLALERLFALEALRANMLVLKASNFQGLSVCLSVCLSVR